ncbi:hypothetical protein B7P43_G18188 [Cryptotermes secundus]|uniref:Protein kinase domain-containing protein n=1 Tax=Cryptotermes secundus TaxID=105785 RepID=A0A2J7PGH8_9NEOP|nr:hypothetical protein B7P43_G18188 [Cryptotermes secundus]
MKVIDLEKNSGAQSSVQKEVFIHRMVNHSNIVRFYGHRHDGNLEYIFLEFLSGGDLFDRITGHGKEMEGAVVFKSYKK